MALTATERQRRRRARLREEERRGPDATSGFLRRSFASFLEQDAEAQNNGLPFIRETLGSIGLDRIDWEEDADPEWHQYQWIGTEDRRLLGKAERAVGAFIDTARVLSELINRFKLQEIDQAIAAIEDADLSDPADKKQALANVVRLNRLRTRLQKEVRHAFPATTAKGE